MFGAWQAGVWRGLASKFQPDLIVGASVGSLNGYAIAIGMTPDELCGFWQRGTGAGFKALHSTAHHLTARPLRMEYAVTLVDVLRMKPVTFRGQSVTWRHLVASCAIPIMMPPQHLAGHWYVDGGLLNPVPVWAAVELGAKNVVAVNALPEIPSMILRPFVKGFRAVFGHHPPVPPGVTLTTITPGARLGSMRDALHWNRDNAERWIEQGERDAQDISIPICFEGCGSV